MTVTQSPPRSSTRRPAWSLVLTLPAYVLYLVVAVATVARQVDTTSAELTPAQLSELGLAWPALHVLWIAPAVLAAFGLTGIAAVLDLPRRGALRVLTGVVAATVAAYLVVQLLAFGFDGAVWGDSRLYGLGVVLSLATGWFGTLPATILVATALARRGIARRSAWAVAVLCGLYLVVEVLTYLPALAGSATLADTVGLPPFLLGIFWAWLGGAVLRAHVPSGE